MDEQLIQAYASQIVRLQTENALLLDAIKQIKTYYDALEKYPVVPVSEIRQLISLVIGTVEGNK